MQAEVKRLVELRSQIAEYDDAYEKATAPLKLERDALQAQITEELKKMGVLSQRFQEATVTRSVRKTVHIADQAAATADLKAKGLGDNVKWRLLAVGTRLWSCHEYYYHTGILLILPLGRIRT